MRHETYIELECIVEGDFLPGSKGKNDPLAGIYEPSTLPELENATVKVKVGEVEGNDGILKDLTIELPECHPMFDQIVYEALQSKLQELEDEMHARADYEYDRRREG